MLDNTRKTEGKHLQIITIYNISFLQGWGKNLSGLLSYQLQAPLAEKRRLQSLTVLNIGDLYPFLPGNTYKLPPEVTHSH